MLEHKLITYGITIIVDRVSERLEGRVAGQSFPFASVVVTSDFCQRGGRFIALIYV